MRRVIFMASVLFIMLLVAACSNTNESPASNQENKEVEQKEQSEKVPGRLKNLSRDWDTNWEKHTIPYGDIISGGPPRDGIPSIDDPKFIPIDNAKKWLDPQEPVMVVNINEEVRAYPIQILIWHEIVNDVVRNKPILVSYCPLCNSAIVFDREVNGETFEFGTSGLLVHSDLVMYDRTTETLWQQLTGEAIVGDLVGEQLTMISSSLISFQDFATAHPDGMVLSKETGYKRNYGQSPYPGYDGRTSSFFSKGDGEGRLPAMERVVSVSINKEDKAYPYTTLKEEKVIQDTVGHKKLVIFFKTGTKSALNSQVIEKSKDVGSTGVFIPRANGQDLTIVKEKEGFIDKETASTWNILGKATAGPLKGTQLESVVHGDHFWFSWVAFKPNTKVYLPDEREE